MISVIKTHLILLLILFSSPGLNAQNSGLEQFNFAKKLFVEEKYFDAVTEFKRLLFFDESADYSFEANRLIGLSYKQGAKFSDAVYHFSEAELNARTDEESFEMKIEIVKINILRRTTERALKLLENLEGDERFANKQNEINYWRGWAYFFADDWQQASFSFEQIDSSHSLKIFADSVHNNFYDVTLAKVLSTFLPGAGQFYTSEYISGLISLGWNVLWGYLTINAFVEDRVFDGVMVGTLLWWRFYTGNRHNAETFAEEKNLEMSNNALKYLKENYTGPKP
jgi:hypothetical protein